MVSTSSGSFRVRRSSAVCNLWLQAVMTLGMLTPSLVWAWISMALIGSQLTILRGGARRDRVGRVESAARVMLRHHPSWKAEQTWA